jgi:hypothetical protein
MTTSNELTREERVSIAACHFGLYMLPMTLFDAKQVESGTGSTGPLVDIDCAMDNMGVPHYRDDAKMRPEFLETLEREALVVQQIKDGTFVMPTIDAAVQAEIDRIKQDPAFVERLNSAMGNDFKMQRERNKQ